MNWGQQLQPKPVLITRQDGNRAIKLTASALPGFTAPELYEQVEKYLNNELKLDSGYSWSVGGVNEQNQESTQSIINAMGISGDGTKILVSIEPQFNSIKDDMYYSGTKNTYFGSKLIAMDSHRNVLWEFEYKNSTGVYVISNAVISKNGAYVACTVSEIVQESRMVGSVEEKSMKIFDERY